MFVRDLPAARGMLFVAKEPRVFDMWMRNTYIPLDMVFIAADGRISTIAENTTPHSLAIVSSKVPVGRHSGAQRGRSGASRTARGR